jgi:hypothetical protein
MGKHHMSLLDCFEGFFLYQVVKVNLGGNWKIDGVAASDVNGGKLMLDHRISMMVNTI